MFFFVIIRNILVLMNYKSYFFVYNFSVIKLHKSYNESKFALNKEFFDELSKFFLHLCFTNLLENYIFSILKIPKFYSCIERIWWRTELGEMLIYFCFF